MSVILLYGSGYPPQLKPNFFKFKFTKSKSYRNISLLKKPALKFDIYLKNEKQEEFAKVL